MSIKFTADRGMFSEGNLKKLAEMNTNYVVAARLKRMGQEMDKKILAVHEQGSADCHLVKDIAWKGRRLVVCYNPATAAKDRQVRQRLLERLAKISGGKEKFTTKNLIKNDGTSRFLDFSDNKEIASISHGKIANAERWDGIHGYVTNSDKPALEVIANYKRLWEIEEAFRINKHDLKMRPIYHHKPERIVAHLDICFIVYALARQLMARYQLQQGKRISFREIHDALSATEVSHLIHIATKKRYFLPSASSPLVQRLYRIVGLKYSNVPGKI